MTEDEWHAGWVRCLGVRLSGKTLDDTDRYGEPLTDDTYLICLNPHHEHIQFYLPPCTASCSWEEILDTNSTAILGEARTLKDGEPYDISEHSAVVFREVQQNTAPLQEVVADVQKKRKTKPKQMAPV
jgi:glycogen operon protein